MKGVSDPHLDTTVPAFSMGLALHVLRLQGKAFGHSFGMFAVVIVPLLHRAKYERLAPHTSIKRLTRDCSSKGIGTSHV